jgi:hypothetical protein
MLPNIVERIVVLQEAASEVVCLAGVKFSDFSLSLGLSTVVFGPPMGQ